MYVVGQPHNQNWQHVYTAVTRGIKQVFIINNSAHLERAIKALPIPRQTKLKEDVAWSDSRSQLQLSSEELFTRDGRNVSSSERASEFSTTGVSCRETHHTLLQPASPPRGSDFQGPSGKRKYPESGDEVDLGFLPKTPPSLKNLSSSLHVSPLMQSSNQTQEAAVSRPGATATVRAQFGSFCKICKKSINIGDEITFVYTDSKKMWIHSRCKPCK